MKEFKRIFNSLQLIINHKTWFVTFLAVIATHLCDYFEFIGDLPITLIGTAIIFPVVFSINSAYKRREDAINLYASLKANWLALFMAIKNWTDTEQEHYKTNIQKELVASVKLIHDYFLQNSATYNKFEAAIYNKFNDISRLIQETRKAGITPSELSRMDQYLTRGINDYERMRTIFVYRTPNSLRTYSKFFIYTFPVLYAPYFAHHLKDGQEIMGYISAILYSFVFMSLVNIQDQLENPFDQVGEDDIEFDLPEFEMMLSSITDKQTLNKQLS